MENLQKAVSELHTTAIFITGVSGSGKSYAMDVISAKAVDGDDFGRRKNGKWIIDWKRAWANAPSTHSGSKIVVGVSDNLQAVFDSVDLPKAIILIRPKVSMWREILQLKIADADPSLPKGWSELRRKAAESPASAKKVLDKFDAEVESFARSNSISIRRVSNSLLTGKLERGWHEPNASRTHSVYKFGDGRIMMRSLRKGSPWFSARVHPERGIRSVKFYSDEALAKTIASHWETQHPEHASLDQMWKLVKTLVPYHDFKPLGQVRLFVNNETGEMRYVQGRLVVKTFGDRNKWTIKIGTGESDASAWNTKYDHTAQASSVPSFKKIVTKVNNFVIEDV